MDSRSPLSRGQVYTCESRCGNDKLCYIVVIERLTISVGSKTVSLSYLLIDLANLPGIRGMVRILSVIVNGHWRPGIGDPTFMGWLITAAYLIVSVLCGVCAWRTDRISPISRFRHHCAFWWCLAVAMLLMGINKQLDIQCLFIAVIKKIALNQGWYSQHQTLQVWFIACIAIFGLVLLIWLGWKLKGLWRQYGLALFGILLLITFVIIRAAPLNHVAGFYGWQPVIGLINSILELAGIGLVGISALMGIYRGTKQAAKITES